MKEPSLNYPRTWLTLHFAIWKMFLLAVALIAPGPGYDTSTNLFFSQSDKSSHLTSINLKHFRLSNLLRWDAIFFTQIAHNGYKFEQEWAFGWGFTKLLGFAATGIKGTASSESAYTELLAGIFVAHGSHFLSVHVLYQLSLDVSLHVSNTKTRKFAFLAALFHVISPAGMFLSAPYAESSFSFLNFAGFFLYARSHRERFGGRDGKSCVLLAASGLLFGLASTFRSNGLLSGMIFCSEAIDTTVALLKLHNIGANLQHLCAVFLTGGFVAFGAITPQYLAYREYCVHTDSLEDRRPWCSKWVPSIYTWVQDYYWGLGFLRYWTVSNIPLFILAAPALYILMQSAIWGYGWCREDNSVLSGATKSSRSEEKAKESKSTSFTNTDIIRQISIPQAALTILALTNFHVQIITRISSGYPVWYWWLASTMIEDHDLQIFGRRWEPAKVTVRWMVIYAVLQGGLFASFLPPA